VAAIGAPMELGEFDDDTGRFRPLGADTEDDDTIALSGTERADLTVTEAYEAEDGNDPISEADFHMAYGLYHQAAELIDQALEREPARTDLQAKLLEIYFVWGNKDEFRQAAARLQPSLAAAPGEWEKVAIMGRQICPDDSLFEAGSAPLAGGADLDVGLETAATPYDVDLGDAGSDDEPALDLGLDLGDDEDGEDTGFFRVGDDDEMSADGRGDADALDFPLAADADGEPTGVSGGDEGTWADSGSDMEQDEELTEIARKLEARMAPESDPDFSLSLDLGQTIAPDVSASRDESPVSMDDGEDDGFGDFFAFTGVVEESEGDDASADDASDDPLLDESGELLPLSGSGEFQIDLPEEPLADTVEQRMHGVEASPTAVTGTTVGLSDASSSADTEQQPTIALDGDGLMVGAGDETQESLLFHGGDEADDRTAVVSTTSMLSGGGEDFGAGDRTVESHLLESAEHDPASSPTVQMPMADFGGMSGDVSSTAETVSAQVLDLHPRGGQDSDAGDGEQTVRVTAAEFGMPEGEGDAVDEVGTKLDLARAYIDMGDAESARSILEEVVQEGSSAQRDDANNLLSSLG
jgi:pilus assembly protein FimV